MSSSSSSSLKRKPAQAKLKEGGPKKRETKKTKTEDGNGERGASLGSRAMRVGDRAISNLVGYTKGLVIEIVGEDHPGNVDLEKLELLWGRSSSSPSSSPELSKVLGYWYTLDDRSLLAAQLVLAEKHKDVQAFKKPSASSWTLGITPEEHLKKFNIPYPQLEANRINELSPEIRFKIVDAGYGEHAEHIRRFLMKDSITGEPTVHNCEELVGKLKSITHNPILTYPVTFGMTRLNEVPSPSLVSIPEAEFAPPEGGSKCVLTPSSDGSLFAHWRELDHIDVVNSDVYRVYLTMNDFVYVAVDPDTPKSTNKGPEALSKGLRHAAFKPKDPCLPSSAFSSMLQKQTRSNRPDVSLSLGCFLAMCQKPPAHRGFPHPVLSPANALTSALIRLIKIFVEDSCLPKGYSWLVHKVLQAHCGRGLTDRQFSVVISMMEKCLLHDAVGWDRFPCIGTPKAPRFVGRQPLSVIAAFPGMSGDITMLMRCAEQMEQGMYPYCHNPDTDNLFNLRDALPWFESATFREPIDLKAAENAFAAAGCFHTTPDSITTMLSDPRVAIALHKEPNPADHLVSLIWDLKSGDNWRRPERPAAKPNPQLLKAFGKLPALKNFVVKAMVSVGKRRVLAALGKAQSAEAKIVLDETVFDPRGLFVSALLRCLADGLPMGDGGFFHVFQGRAFRQKGVDAMEESAFSAPVASLFPELDLETRTEEEGGPFPPWMSVETVLKALKRSDWFAFHPAWYAVEAHLPYGRARFACATDFAGLQHLEVSFQKASGTGTNPVFREVCTISREGLAKLPPAAIRSAFEIDPDVFPKGLAGGVKRLCDLLVTQRGGVLVFPTYKRRGEPVDHNVDDFLALAALKTLVEKGPREVSSTISATDKPHVWRIVPPYDSLLNGLRSVQKVLWKKDGLAVSHDPKDTTLEDFEAAKAWLKPGLALHSFQEECAKKILRGYVKQEGERHRYDSTVMNTMPMGMGKTLVGLDVFACHVAAYDRMREASEPCEMPSALVLVPPNIPQVWKREAEKFFSPDARDGAEPFRVTVISEPYVAVQRQKTRKPPPCLYEQHRSNGVPTVYVMEYDKWRDMVKAFGFPPIVFTMLGFDEAHMLRDPTTQRSRFADAWTMSYMLITGTPVMNVMPEIFRLLEKSRIPIHGHPTFEQHCRERRHYAEALHTRLYYSKGFSPEPVFPLPNLRCSLAPGARSKYNATLSRLRSRADEESISTLTRLIDDHSDKGVKLTEFLSEKWRGELEGKEEGEDDFFGLRTSYKKGALERRSLADLSKGVEKGIVTVGRFDLEAWYQELPSRRSKPKADVMKRIDDHHAKSDFKSLSLCYLDDVSKSSGKTVSVRLNDPATKPGFKTLVFCNTHTQKNSLVAILNARRPGCAVSLVSQDNIDLFERSKDVRVGVGLYSQIGLGLNIQFVELVVFYSLHPNPGVMLQAECRTNRQGQKNTVKTLYCIATDTIDESIHDILVNKTTAIRSAVEGSGKVDTFKTILLDAARMIKGDAEPEAKALSVTEEEKDSDACVICMSERRNVVFMPCGHCGCCKGCSESLRERRCVFCRGIVTKIVGIDDVGSGEKVYRC